MSITRDEDHDAYHSISEETTRPVLSVLSTSRLEEEKRGVDLMENQLSISKYKVTK